MRLDEGHASGAKHCDFELGNGGFAREKQILRPRRNERDAPSGFFSAFDVFRFAVTLLFLVGRVLVLFAPFFLVGFFLACKS